jgi:hypothetical protein
VLVLFQPHWHAHCGRRGWRIIVIIAILLAAADGADPSQLLAASRGRPGG